MDSEQLCRWLADQNVSGDVVANFRGTITLFSTSVTFRSLENEMDGEASVALLTTVQGPDCLKDSIPKLGLRLKVYQRIKAVYIVEVNCLVSCMVQYHWIMDLQNGFDAAQGEEFDDVSSLASSKVQNYTIIY